MKWVLSALLLILIYLAGWGCDTQPYSQGKAHPYNASMAFADGHVEQPSFRDLDGYVGTLGPAIDQALFGSGSFSDFPELASQYD